MKNVPAKTTLSRRSFLALMSLVSISSALAIYEVLAEDNPGVQIAEAEPVKPTSTSGLVSATATTESVLPTATSEQTLTTATTAKSGQTRKRGNRATPTSAEVLPAATADTTITADTTAAETIEPTATPQPTATAIATSEVQACVVRCSRGCSYPGSCRRYTDQNNNGLCDLGECL